MSGKVERMRLDQYLQKSCEISRKEARNLLKRESVTINGERERQGKRVIDPVSDQIELNGERLILETSPRYFVLYKPSGYVSSHRDDGHPSLFRLLDEPRVMELHIAGRLDADTTGLTLITDDGDWSHKVAHPNRKINKRYRVTLENPLTEAMIKSLATGVLLRNDPDPTLPATVEKLSDTECYLTISEGRYHQVKRVMAAVGNLVVALHRDRVGIIDLEGLSVGEYRPLTNDEIEGILA